MSVSVSEAIDDWVKRNAGAISLYWRGGLARFLKLSCPLCGKPLRRIRNGKFICGDQDCQLISVELYKGYVTVNVEPLLSVTYRLFSVWCEREAVRDFIPRKWSGPYK